ncbi:MAG: hypothetical protein ACOX05_01175 [Bacillota bacterium]
MHRSPVPWIVLGGVAGLVTAGVVKRNISHGKMRHMKRKAARFTSSTARNAGHMISAFGDELARKMY